MYRFQARLSCAQEEKKPRPVPRLMQALTLQLKLLPARPGLWVQSELLELEAQQEQSELKEQKVPTQIGMQAPPPPQALTQAQPPRCHEKFSYAPPAIPTRSGKHAQLPLRR
jgi:hypothetical protein